MVEYTYHAGPAKAHLKQFVGSSSNLAFLREQIAERAVGWGADYLLWLDADHAFPPDTLLRLANHDLPVVGCNFINRRFYEQHCKLWPTSHKIVEGKPEPLWTTAEKAGTIEEADIAGFGLMLMKAEVFRRPKPWFTDSKDGEDADFYRLLWPHNIRPHIDHSLSLEVGHIAETVLTFPR